MWKEIAGFPNYEISDQGVIRSIKRGKIMKTRLDIRGYEVLKLRKDNKSWYRRVNRLVAETFIPNPNNLPEVNHINGIKTDNFRANLEWVSQEENINHARENKLLSKASRVVVQYSKEGNYIREFESATEAAKDVGAKNPSGIISVCNKYGHCKTAKGYVWRYKDAD